MYTCHRETEEMLTVPEDYQVDFQNWQTRDEKINEAGVKLPSISDVLWADVTSKSH